MTENELKFLKMLQDERDQITSLRDDMNKNIGELASLNISERRIFFQHITLLSLGLCGVTFFVDKAVNNNYLIIGFSLLILVVILILTWLRENLDKESVGLQSLQDGYNLMIEEKIKIIEEFSKKQFNENLLFEYFSRLGRMPGYLALSEDIEKEKKLRENRDKQLLDFFGELILFLFISGVVFLFISLLNYNPKWYLISSIILLIFSLSFQDFVLKLMSLISRGISYLHKKI